MQFSLRRNGIVLLLLAGVAGALLALLEHRRPTVPSQPGPAASSATATSAATALPELPLSPHFAAQAGRREAYAALRSAVEQSPRGPVPLTRLAIFLLEADEPLASRTVLARLLQLEPDGEAALGLAGTAELRLGHLDRSLDLFRRLVEHYPTSWSGWYHRGLVSARLRRFSEAETSFSTAIQRNSTVFWPHLGLGLLRLRLQRPQEALAALDDAASRSPSDPGLQVHRMHALAALGDAASAEQAYREYLRAQTQGTSEAKLQLRRPLAPPENAESGALRFTDVAPQLQLAHPGLGRAAAFADLDGDGHLDLLVGYLEEATRLHLSRQRGSSFVEATARAGLGFFDNAAGLSAGDLDNDGDLDLYVSRGGFQLDRRGRDANLLLLNQGDGTFTDATVRSGAGDPGMGLATVLADFDRDGLLDLFVVNNGEASRLLRNRGDGTFEEAGEQAGVSGAHPSVSAVAADLDDDGDADLFVASNGGDNLLYRNDTPPGGKLRFAEVGFEARLALSGGYGCTVADFDNDGRLDLFVANMNDWNGGDRFDPGDPSYLFLNQGGMKFAETAWAAGLRYVGGAVAPVAADFDADGWVDIYLATGGPEPGRSEADVLYRNLGIRADSSGSGLRFAEVTRAAGVFRPTLSGQGVTVADYDADGDLDLFVPGGNLLPSDLGLPALWRNDSPQGHRVMLRLVGTKSNRSAIGARAVLRTGELQRVEEVSQSTGCGGQRSLDLFLGLGSRSVVDSLAIRWPSGAVTELGSVPTDRLLVVTEGKPGFEER